MKVCIMVYAPQKGLLASMGKELQAGGHEICFAARDRNVEKVLRRHFPDLGSDELVVMSDLPPAPRENPMAECLRCEKAYGESFAMMVAHDRGLGRGYLFNVQGYPAILRSWRRKDEKYQEILGEFLCYEAVFDRLCPDVVVAVAIPKSAHLVCRGRNIAVRILTPPRFGSLYRWTVDETEQSPALTRALEQRVAEFFEKDELPATELEQTAFAQHFFITYKYDYPNAVKRALGRIPAELYQLLKGTHRRYAGGYEFLGWCGPLLRKPGIFKYLQRNGVRPAEVQGGRVVLFPLHMEPEASLLNLSPELNNSMELITWVSKSLPADALLVVKEHPDSFGLRPRFFYDNLRRMANVVLAHPEVHGKQWLAACDVLANITSTMGFEAVAMEKPVISFGAHQVINGLPTVEYADSFAATRAALGKLFGEDSGRARNLQVARVALDMAFKDVCFDLSGYESIFKSVDLHMDLACKALDGLRHEFPGLSAPRAAS